MTKFKKKMTALLIITLVTVFSIVNIAYAAGNKKMLEAFYGVAKIMYNGQDLTSQSQPFIVNGTTYLPLRKLADIFGKDISWDQSTGTITLVDKPDSDTAVLQQQVYSKNLQIADLQAKVTDLENKLKRSQSSDLSDLEDTLNGDYDEYKNIAFDISLSGNEDEITVKIEYDGSDYSSEWNALTSTQKTSYLQDICDDILDEYEDASIDGYIKDTYYSVKRLSFYTSSSGTVKLGTSSSSNDLSDLEDTLNDDYYDYFSGIDLSVELDGDEDAVTFIVNIDLGDYGTRWSSISDSSKESFLSHIADDIKDDSTFGDAEITGYIYDTNDDENLMKIYELNGQYKYRVY